MVTVDKAEMAARLMGAIGYTFQRPELLIASVTHRSFVNESADRLAFDNERLEFLGDAVLGLVVATELMQRFPSAQEGVLSRLRASMVDEAALHKLAVALGLGEALRLGRGEELSGGRTRSSLLADAFEAMIGAAYLDGGLDAARVILDRCLSYPGAAEAPVDPKTELQERLQAAKRAPPTYRLVGEEGPDHAKTFAVEVSVEGRVVARGEGRTKKEAERAAASVVLESPTLGAEDPEATAAPDPDLLAK
ncbi:MAG: ribonuclease III [Myxococcota bacterium]